MSLLFCWYTSYIFKISTLSQPQTLSVVPTLYHTRSTLHRRNILRENLSCGVWVLLYCCSLLESSIAYYVLVQLRRRERVCSTRFLALTHRKKNTAQCPALGLCGAKLQSRRHKILFVPGRPVPIRQAASAGVDQLRLRIAGYILTLRTNERQRMIIATIIKENKMRMERKIIF